MEPGDFYFEGGLMVLTAQYHLRRGSCCGNGCRHCPYDHVAVSRPPGCGNRLDMNGTDLVPPPDASDRVRGSLDAPVVITEFADFECPYCADAHAALQAVLPAYGDRVALVFRQFPLQMHPHARHAALAAEVAADAGKFWEMHDLLFEHNRHLTDSDLQTYATQLGIPAGTLRAGLDDAAHTERIERDRRSGEDSGIGGTPSLFINGYAYEGDLSPGDLRAAIDGVLSPAH
jgi:protein-disulfide isomerase